MMPATRCPSVTVALHRLEGEDFIRSLRGRSLFAIEMRLRRSRAVLMAAPIWNTSICWATDYPLLETTTSAINGRQANNARHFGGETMDIDKIRKRAQELTASIITLTAKTAKTTTELAAG